MRIAVIGGGPGGLYFAYLWKRRHPDAHIDLFEQNPEGATWGFGVVFSEQALEFLRADDPETVDAITPRMESWKNITLNLRGQSVEIDGVGFSSIGRLELLTILQQRVRAAGVTPRYDTTIQSVDELGGYDLIVAADGLNSLVRRGFEKEFGASVSHSTNKFAWYGTTKRFATLSQTFVKTDLGSFNAHHYRYSPAMSTFLVECDAATWQAYGFEHKTIEQSQAICEQVFADTLDGHPLVSNKSVWRNFPWIWNENWSHGNMVLIGDALHSAHFSIGSGTRLAIEDAIALTKALEAENGYPRRPRPLPGRTQADRAEAGDGGAHQRRLVRTFPRAHEARPDGFCLQLHHPLGADRRCAAARDVAGIHGALRGGKEDREPDMTSEISDQVPRDSPGAREIGFALPENYNASRILFDNLAAGRGDRLALTGPGGTRTLCAALRRSLAMGPWLPVARLEARRPHPDVPRRHAGLSGGVLRRGAVGLRAAVDQHADAAGPAAVLSLGRRRSGSGRGGRVYLALQCGGLQGHAAANA